MSFIIENKFTFAKEYSYEDLLIANYIPIISLLFESDLVKSLMFDESFELYEDWDLLLRAGEITEFHFVNKTTALYNHWGNSQIAFNSSAEVIKQATLKIYTKHLNKFNPLLIYRLSNEEWANRPEVKELHTIIQNKDNILNDSEKKYSS